MHALKIVVLCVAAAVVYGIAHDQVTARVCVEYFTIGHPPIFGGTDNPTLLAFGWGVFATWWVGLIFGVAAAFLARVGVRPKLAWHDLRRPIGMLMIVVAVTAVAGGFAGYANGRTVADLAAFEKRGIAAERVPLYQADAVAHSSAYLTSFFGGILVCSWIWWRRGREERRALVAELERLRREKADLIQQLSNKSNEDGN